MAVTTHGMSHTPIYRVMKRGLSLKEAIQHLVNLKEKQYA